MFNLLSNALKFTLEGSIDVTLRIVEQHFEFVVRDTGIGIAPADQAHVFDRFHRIKGARARSHEGTGIGLALAFEVVKLHGGEISVDSVVGQGTAFTVRLPRGYAHLPADRINAARTLSSTGTGVAPYIAESRHWDESDTHGTPADDMPQVPGRRSARILVVDDNADMRGYVSRLLAERWTVEPVSNGVLALEAIRREAKPVDLNALCGWMRRSCGCS